MNENDHTNITQILSNFIIENSNKLNNSDISKTNCWEAGMLKAICLINDYYKGE